MSTPPPNYSLPSILPRAALEQMIVERTISNAQFRDQLLTDPIAALGDLFGTPLPEGLDVRVYVEDPNTFYYVTPNTDPSLDAFHTESSVARPNISVREPFIARLNYLFSTTDANPDDLPSLATELAQADTAADEASQQARDAEVEAAQAGQAVEDAEIAYDESVAAAELAPDDPNLAQAVDEAQATLQEAQQTADTDASTASDLRDQAIQLSGQADDANEAYEDAVRAAFQQEFATHPLNALTQFLNLKTPFTSVETIVDTDLPEGNTPPSSDSQSGEKRFVHLVETSGQVIFIILPYATNHCVLMGPYSVAFNGTSSYIRIPRSASMEVQSLLTVEVWAWVDTFREDAQDVLLSTLAGGGGWQIEVGGGVPKFTLTLDGTEQVVTPGQEHLTLQTGTWNYLVGVFDGENLSLYVNGNRWGQTTVSGEVTTGGDLLIGRNAAMQADSSFFMGMIHEARLWSDAFTLETIATNLPVRQPVDNLPTALQEALIASYILDEGTGFTALDDSLYHNDGAMVDSVWQITGFDSPA